ncbi:hypothetical protein FRX31_011311 [Thalictrum thalictroides]|uniref:Uncharacterized protein n=1 Tax=Thalictrum thalictroides TaxID=46969 RepID=A0A7J6WNZ6_THATH|nr:hypothetical protein FRX31_011311 [Thalictrum thalictroides]
MLEFILKSTYDLKTLPHSCQLWLRFSCTMGKLTLVPSMKNTNSKVFFYVSHMCISQSASEIRKLQVLPWSFGSS